MRVRRGARRAVSGALRGVENLAENDILLAQPFLWDPRISFFHRICEAFLTSECMQHSTLKCDPEIPKKNPAGPTLQLLTQDITHFGFNSPQRPQQLPKLNPAASHRRQEIKSCRKQTN